MATLPAEYSSAFVTLHGSWDRSRRTGYKVVRLIFDRNGRPTGEYEDFMTGFVISDKQVWSIAENGDVGIAKELTSEGTCSAPQVKWACVRTCRPSKWRRNRHYDLVMYHGSGRDQRQSARMRQTARDAG